MFLKPSFQFLFIILCFISIQACSKNQAPSDEDNKLSAPSISLEKDNSNKLSLTWNTVENASSYTINWHKGDELSNSKSSIIDKGINKIDFSTEIFDNISPGEHVFINVKINYPDGTSEASNIIQSKLPPDQIGTLINTASHGYAKFTWQENADSFNLYWYTGDVDNMILSANSIK